MVKQPSTHYIAMDCTDWLAVVVETSRPGAQLLVSIHMCPHYNFAENKAVLVAICQLFQLVRAHLGNHHTCCP